MGVEVGVEVPGMFPQPPDRAAHHEHVVGVDEET